MWGTGVAFWWWQGGQELALGRGHSGEGVPVSPERPLHPKEKVLEQALQWCKLPEPSTAYLLVRKVPIGEGSCLFTGKASTKGLSPSGCPQRGTALPELPLALLTALRPSGAQPQGPEWDPPAIPPCQPP